MDSEAILWKVVEDLLSLVSRDQTANNGFLQDSSVGKGLSKDDKAQKLALQHWLEAEIAAASCHRNGHNLHLYYDIWIESQSTRPFFYRLDVGDGKEINLDKCPRSTLQRQCIKIKYLGPKSDGEEVKEEDVVFHGVGTLQDLCEILIQILGSRNRDIRNSKHTKDHNIGEAKKAKWKTPWNENAEFDQVISDVLHMPDMDGFKLLELVGLEMDLPVINGWQSRWVKSDWKRSEGKAGSFKHTAGDPDYNLTLWDLIEFEQFIVNQKNFGRDTMTHSPEQLSRNESLRQEKQQKMSIHWNSLIFMGTSYQRIGRATFEAATISLYKLHTALSRNHFAALTGSKLLTCNCQNKEHMNTKGNRVSQLDNNHESRVAVVLDIILMEGGRVQLQDNSTGCDLNNHKIIKLVLGTGETALNTAERTGNSDVEDILVEHGTVQSAKAMKAQAATAIARELKQTVSDIKHQVHHLMEALNCWAQLDDNLTLCDLINNNHKETVPRDPSVFQHHDNTFNDQHIRKKTARRVSSFVFSTVVFLGILFDVIQVQQPLHKERDPVSMWPTLLGLFGLMVFLWAVAIMILVGSPFTRMHTAMLLFWAILMLLQSVNTTGSLGILFMGWYAYALGEATTK